MRIDTISNRGEWDRFWGEHAPQALFQSWAWGEVVKRQSIPVARFGLYDGSCLVGMYQVVTVRARRGTYLHIRHGPVIIGTNPEVWECIITFLQNFAKDQRASFIRMNPPFEDTKTNHILLRSFGMRPAAVHEVDAERCWVLDITPDEESLLSGMRKTTRYEIRRSEKVEIRVVSSTDPTDLDKFFGLYQKTSQRQHFVAHTGIRDEFEVFAGEGNAVLLLGYHEHTLLSAAIILFSGRQAIYHHGASSPTKFPVNYAVQWKAIREAKRRGMRIYNFWGIAPAVTKNHPWQGLTLFKTGFGGQEVRTIHAHDLPLSPRYWVTRSIEWWEMRKRGY